MNERSAILFDCVERPADDLPRAVLADWLDDRGEAARAELIRVQCRLAAWVPDWQERRRLIERQDELLAAHRREWLGPLTGLCERITFERGLCRLQVAGAKAASSAFAEALAAAGDTALVEGVRLTRVSELSRLASRPWLADVPSLSLERLRLNDGALTALLDGPHTQRLHSLDLSNASVPSGDAERLFDHIRAGWLVRLAARNCRLDDALLASVSAGGRLRELDVAGSTATPTAFASLLPSSRVMNSAGMEFVRVPAGSFLMGADDGEEDALHDERPRRVITLTRPFWLGRFAVTLGQYRIVSGQGPLVIRANVPVGRLSRYDAEQFCRWLNDLPAERDAGRSYRLPTEAEWEHACRAGTFTAFHFGDRPPPELINCQPGYLSTEWVYRYHGRLAPVGTYPPNAFGLYEMHGNIWEWTSTWYDARGYEVGDETDPIGPASGNSCITRGGCWQAHGSSCRSARRGTVNPHDRHNTDGFRVVLETTPTRAG